jgi:hypothetical protein
LKTSLKILRGDAVWVARRRLKCDREVVEDRVEKILGMRTKIPLSHGNLQDGKDNHQVSRILLAIKVGDEPGQKVMVIVVQILESFAIVPE